MRTQLVDRYFRDNVCQHGLYLVGWFNCDRWDPDDRRRASSRRISREEGRQRLDDQAGAVSQGAVTVRAFVLNAALR